jgi:Flp pilus assembly protein TadD
MISALLAAAAVASSPVPQSPAPHDLIAGAEHALRVGRVDQAKLMIERAVGAGASGVELDHALADLAYASGKNDEALARYTALLKLAPSDRALLEPAGIAALKLDHVEAAYSLLSRATSEPGSSWRAWNALGVVADRKSDWNLADRCFAEATRRAPSEAEPLNNRGWSLLLRGRWSEAASLFAKSALIDPKSARTANNLELARSALAADLPERRLSESASSWASRLNDAGVVAAILGEKERATAAFTRALEVSDTWYPRAAGNLEALGGR